ncbi:pyridoxal-phosphate dependent enzyme [Glaciecola sp. MH2013]|uniref:1-aminocyclopropane-1-carboxylate deaminase/D-cysteine desulfhydrase n=1 Tax=Glaciecola sp. MH2013 TaxID=2785524 RepID=UPI00189F9118|nr:pyridoxal-phosphate dependent enzyme [Glaciecola sp. MH2013]MBF7071975.1 pyridoxal-phosphate dependent enzyme [Glaciecola sp. MH2013]
MHHPFRHISTMANYLGIAQNSPLHQIKLPAQLEFNSTIATTLHEQIQVWCKRDDLLHPIISGNKWRKLQHALATFETQSEALATQASRPRRIVSFGGAYSNHLHALAYCCNKLNIALIAVIRGQYLANETLNPTLQDMTLWGARLHFVSKTDYRRRHDPEYLQQLKSKFDADLIIPEGGSQISSLHGLAQMMQEIQEQAQELELAQLNASIFDEFFLPVASGATMAGVVKAEHATNKSIAKTITGVAVLKGEGYLEGLVQQFLPQFRPPETSDWQIEHHYSFGGYAKTSPELDAFCASVKEINHHPDAEEKSIRIEPCYSGKLFYAVNNMLEQGRFSKGSKLLLLHTGGLQGKRPPTKP